MAALPDGNDIQGVDNTGSTFSLRSFVYAAGKRVLGSLIVDATGADQVGVGGTGITQPTGGAGILGWLSGIFKLLNGGLPVALGTRSAATSLGVALSTEDALALASPVPDLTGSGALDLTALNATYVITPRGYAGLALDIPALAGGAVLAFEQLATATSTTWDAINAVPLGGGVIITQASAAGRFEGIGAGAYQIRVRVATVGTGTVTIRHELTAGQKLIRVFNTSPMNLGAYTVADPRVSDGAGALLTALSATFSANTIGSTAIIAAVAGKKIRVLSISYVSTAANTVDIRDGATSLSGAMDFGATGGIVEPFNPSGVYADGTINTALNLNLTAATKVAGHLKYVLV
jgi:hypothetical protein